MKLERAQSVILTLMNEATYLYMLGQNSEASDKLILAKHLLFMFSDTNQLINAEAEAKKFNNKVTVL